MSAEERDGWLAAQQRQGQRLHEHGGVASAGGSEGSAGAAADGCPASEEARHSARINMPFVPNAPLAGSSGAGSGAGASASLNTARAASSIPIADPSSVPQHQQGPAAAAAHGRSGGAVWMYPSEQQFYNAMERKARAQRWGMGGRG